MGKDEMLEHWKTLLKDFEQNLQPIAIAADGAGLVIRTAKGTNKETWRKIHEIVEERGGEYKGGTGAHWFVPFPQFSEEREAAAQAPAARPRKPGTGLITRTKLMRAWVKTLRAMATNLDAMVAQAEATISQMEQELGDVA